MRKLQSSVQLLERQRNPGVGYWSAGKQAETPTEGRSSVEFTRKSSQVTTPVARDTASPGPSETGTQRNDEEEVNLEVSLARANVMLFSFILL